MIGWFTRLRRRTRILLGFAVFLLALVLGYVGIRAIQYQIYSSVPLESFLPSQADLAAVIRNPRQQWNAMQETEPFKIVENGILKDPVLQPEISLMLAEAGLPTVEEFSDKRVRKQWGALLDGDMAFRFFEEKAVVAARLPRARQNAEVLLIGHLTFSDFLLWPFASMAPTGRGITFEGDRFQIQSANRKKWWGTVQGRAVLLASSTGMLDSALKKSGEWTPPREDITLSIALDKGSVAGDAIRRWASQGPFGLMTHPLDLTGLSRGVMHVECGRKSLMLTVRCSGTDLVNPELVQAARDYLEFVPGENTFLVQPLLGDIHVIWRQLESFTAPQPAPGQGPMTDFSQSHARLFLQPLREYGIEQRLFPYMGKGGLLIMGNEMGIDSGADKGPYPVLGVFLKIREKESKNVAYILGDLTKRLVGESEHVTMGEMMYRGNKMHHFLSKINILGVNSFLRPCYAVVKDTLIITTSLPYMHKILDRISGDSPDFLERHLYTHVMKRGMAARDPNAPVYSAGLSCHDLARGLHSLIPIMAAHSVDTDQRRNWHRVRLGKEFKQNTFGNFEEYLKFIDEKVIEALQEDEKKLTGRMKNQIRGLDYLQYIVLRAREDGGEVVVELEIVPGKR